MTDVAGYKLDLGKHCSELNFRINVVNAQRTMLRFRLALRLLKLAAWIMPPKTEVVVDGPIEPKLFKPGLNGAPPIASSVESVEFRPEIARKIDVFLNGQIVPRVRAYNCEEGLVDLYRDCDWLLERHTGKVAVDWKPQA